MKKNIRLSDIIPIATLIFLFVLFSILTKGQMLTLFNLKAILDQSVLVIIGGLGMIFVISQGSIDLSPGSVIGLSGTLAAMMVTKYGIGWLFPTAIIVGAAIGFINGFVVSKFKVSSFMVTLAMLIAVRGLVNLLLDTRVIFATPEMMNLSSLSTKLLFLVVLIIIMGFIFEFTRVGYFSKAVGENERASQYVGISVTKLKILAFVLAGAMAGIAGVFTVSNLGGASCTMGNFFEFRVMMAIFIGCVPVTGGMTSKIYKLLIGAPTIVLIENGLLICRVSPELSAAIEGILLMVVVFATFYFNSRGLRKVSAVANS